MSINWKRNCAVFGISSHYDNEPTTGVESFPPQISYDFLRGHYKVGLPWKLSKPECTNYGLCVKRLNQLKSRLLREPLLMTEYDTIFKTQLEEGIIERVPSSELDSKRCHFLPHSRGQGHY